MTIPECVDRITMLGAGPEGVKGDLLTFDVSPNRPDLYSVEGIARVLRGVLGLEVGLPDYAVAPSSIEFRVDPNVAAVRPFAVGGVARGLDLDDRLLRSLLDLQEKLHLTVGRKRRKVAIGIHDADTVTPPFVYQAVEPRSVRFIPLGMAEEMDLLEILSRHEKGREYGGIIAGSSRFPVIVDAHGHVLSFPPVINGITTQLSSETRNLFIDVTGTDFDAVSSALRVVACALVERGARLESVRTVYADVARETPDLDPRAHSLDLRRANDLLGLAVTGEEAVTLLRRMRYDARAEGSMIQVLAPAYRTDLLHEFDIAEDLAIAWGYDRYPRRLPKHQTIGSPLPLNEFVEALRVLLIGYGYQEVMSLVLASSKEPFSTPERAEVRNPVTEDLTVLRSSLLPPLLGILRLNRHRELPQRIFEIGDVVRDGRNVCRVATAALHAKASFTEGKSLVQSLLRDVGLTAEVEAADDENFLPGRVAAVRVGGRVVGRFGEIHPRILEAYELVQPAVALELDVEVLHVGRTSDVSPSARPGGA